MWIVVLKVTSSLVKDFKEGERINILKRVNDILLIIVIVLFTSYFLLENKISIYIVYALGSVTFMLTAVEFIKGRQGRGGYKYIFGAFVWLFAAMMSFIK